MSNAAQPIGPLAPRPSRAARAARTALSSATGSATSALTGSSGSASAATSSAVSVTGVGTGSVLSASPVVVSPTASVSWVGSAASVAGSATAAWSATVTAVRSAEGNSAPCALFTTGLPGTWGGIIVTGGLVLFAFSTLIGWSYYGETGAVYLFGSKVAVPYRILWLVFIYLGAVGSLPLIWSIADTLNGLMAIPNLISVLISLPLLRRLHKEFFDARRAGS